MLPHILMFNIAIDNLEDRLNQDLSWRKRELVNLNNELSDKAGNSNQEYSFLIRGSIALIYAHWEGSVKAQLVAYVKFINNLLNDEYLKIDDYHDELLDLIFVPTIKTLSQNTKEKRIKGIKDFKKLYFDKKVITINSKEVINTKSNLSFEVLEDLLYKFSIKSLDVINKQFIEQLLKDRNAISHGENKYSKIDENSRKDIEEKIIEVDKLIESIKTNILEKAESFRV